MVMEVEKREIFLPQMRGGFQSYHLNVMCNFLNKIVGDEINILEIGSFTGESTYIFSHYFNSIHCVDSWKNGNDTTKEAGMESIDMNIVFDAYRNRVKNLQNVSFNRCTSNHFFKSVYKPINHSFNMCYIDGSHEAKQVELDIDNCIKILGSGGIIAGHDFNWNENVNKIVRKKFDDKPLIVFQDGSWVVIPEKYL